MLIYLYFTNATHGRRKVEELNHKFVESLTTNHISFKLDSTKRYGQDYFLELSDEMALWGKNLLTEQKVLFNFEFFQVKKCDCICHIEKNVLHFTSCCQFSGFSLEKA